MSAPPSQSPRRWRPRLRLLHKTLVLVLFSTLAPLLLFGAMSIRRGLDAVGESAQRNLQLVASLTATRLDQLFLDTQRLQGVVATTHTVIDACAMAAPQRQVLVPRVQQQLERVLVSNPDLALIFLADAEGICWFSTSPDMVGRDYKSTREYMRRALAGEQYISELAMGITTREPGVFFSGPVRDMEDRVIGAVAIKLKGQVIDRICGEVDAGISRGFATVLDAQQVIISHRDRSMLYHSIGRLTPEAARIDARLQYGVEQLGSAGLDEVGSVLLQGQAGGNLSFSDGAGDANVAGYARMTQRPWTVVVVQPRVDFDRPLRALARTQWWQSLIVGVLSLGIAALATCALLRPINALRSAALRASRGDWSARARVLTHDELGDLARIFNDMMPKLEQSARMHHALRLAMEVQKQLLPKGSPTIRGLDVVGVNLAADETGGDYYDFLDLSTWQSQTLAVAVGDVTGHGISAALLMATARGLLRSRATPPGTLAALFKDVNERLCDDTPDGRFMTLLYALVDREHRSVRLVSAGHDPIIVYLPDTDVFEEFAGRDLPLGIQRDWVFNEVDYELPEDALLVFGTDGIWETCDATGELFGKDRLRQLIRLHCRDSVEEIKQAVLDALASFRGTAVQQDDVTLVVVRVIPLKSPAGAAFQCLHS